MADGQDPAAAAVVEPQPAASEPNVPDGFGTYDKSSHITIPTTDIDPRYEGRWSGVMGDAHKYQKGADDGMFDDGMAEIRQLARDNNWTARQLHDFISSADQAPAAAPPVQPGYQAPALAAPPADPNQQPLTVAKFNEFREQEKAEAEVTEQNRLLGEEATEVAGILRDSKFNVTDDGRPGDSLAEIAQGVYNKALNQVMQAGIPDWLTGQERQERLNALSSTPSSQAQRQEAKAVFQGWYKDLQNDSVARFAQGLESVPGGSLEGGAGGAVQTPQGKMTHEQEVSQLAAAVEQASGRPMG